MQTEPDAPPHRPWWNAEYSSQPVGSPLGNRPRRDARRVPDRDRDDSHIRLDALRRDWQRDRPGLDLSVTPKNTINSPRSCNLRIAYWLFFCSRKFLLHERNSKLRRSASLLPFGGIAIYFMVVRFDRFRWSIQTTTRTCVLVQPRISATRPRSKMMIEKITF